MSITFTVTMDEEEANKYFLYQRVFGVAYVEVYHGRVRVINPLDVLIKTRPPTTTESPPR